MMPNTDGLRAYRIKVTRESLMQAIEEVWKFCFYIEKHSIYRHTDLLDSQEEV